MSEVTEQQLQALLTRHACPTPLHVLRMRFLGAIASPQLDISPIKTLERSWGGALPEFTSQKNVEELIQAFVEGLWNQLSQHQNASSPFPVTTQGGQTYPARALAANSDALAGAWGLCGRAICGPRGDEPA